MRNRIQRFLRGDGKNRRILTAAAGVLCICLFAVCGFSLARYLLERQALEASALEAKQTVKLRGMMAEWRNEYLIETHPELLQP